MKERIDLQNHMESSLIEVIDSSVQRIQPGTVIDSQSLYEQFLLSGSLTITPPEEKEMGPDLALHCLTLDSLRNYSSGSSIKAGNIVLNIKKAIQTVPDVVMLTVGIVNDIPILKICAALSLWTRIKDVATVEISKEQAFVIVALWKNCDSNKTLSVDKGYKSTLNLLNSYGEGTLTTIKYYSLLDSLERIGCIKIENDMIWLREWISKKYINKV